ALERRIHLLEGFRVVFDALDEVIAIIRASDGKADAARRLMERFPAPPEDTSTKQPTKKGRGKTKPVIQVTGGLDVEQTDAILELKLYRLARLEIQVILDELKKRNARRKEVLALLADDEDDYAAGRWALVRGEIESLIETYGDKNPKRPEGKRRTGFAIGGEAEPEFDEADFIVEEDAVVLVTADGWIKRQKQIDPSSTRVREGDRVLACVAGSTRSVVALFSSRGACYSARVVDLPATTGYGEPVQKLFKLADGERIIAAVSLDPRVAGEIGTVGDEAPAATHGLAATSDGYALRFSLAGYAEPSTRAGRRFARPKAPAEVVGVAVIGGREKVLAVSADRRALVCAAKQVNFLQNPGRGVQLMKLGAADKLLGFKASAGDRDVLRVTTSGGAEETVSSAKYKTVARGGKGIEVRKRGAITGIVPDPVVAPEPFEG
ncbi:MAG: DNA gyrase subunit A, partial [Planctomycetota bacterium]